MPNIGKATSFSTSITHGQFVIVWRIICQNTKTTSTKLMDNEEKHKRVKKTKAKKKPKRKKKNKRKQKTY